MDATLKRLLPTKRLKTKLLKESLERRLPPVLRYDREIDALIVLFVLPEPETIVHYLDEHVALLYEPKSKEIVGFQVEDFQFSFLPKHHELQKVWRLSEATNELKDFGEMIIKVEMIKPIVIKEVIKASEPTLLLQGERLMKTFHENLNLSDCIPA